MCFLVCSSNLILDQSLLTSRQEMAEQEIELLVIFTDLNMQLEQEGGRWFERM